MSLAKYMIKVTKKALSLKT